MGYIMKYETVYLRDLKWVFIFPKFEGETKKEAKEAARMNAFFKKMKEHIAAFSLSPKFPDGGKFTAECTYDRENSLTCCRFLLRQRGRSVRRLKIDYIWKNGYIKNSNIV